VLRAERISPTIAQVGGPGGSIPDNPVCQYQVAMQRIVIAVVDDDPGMRDALETLISAHGLDTELYSSGAAFLHAATTSKAACLIVDVQLGDTTGIELRRQLAAMGCKRPTIFITGSHDETLRHQAAELGCVAYLHKPFPGEHLIEAIASVIGRDFLSR
jgi:FixJ family two-component response regulator